MSNSMNTIHKSEIEKMALAYVDKYSIILSRIDMTMVFDGYVVGAMEVLQKLGITVDTDYE